MKHLDCFAGAGGFSLALKQAIGEVETIGFSEIDKFAIQTYQKNFPWIPNFWDISKIDIANLPDFDVLTGWFPCQDVSVAGKQNLEWWRTILVEYLLQMLEIKKPKYFVFENVKGLMSKKFTTFRNSIFDRIHEAGYEYDVKVLNTRNFWIPQNRERVFIVWSYGKLDFEFPKWEELQVFLKDIIEFWFYNNNNKLKDEIIVKSSIEQVKVRKHALNIEKLKTCLREHKKISINEISKKLNEPKTLVEHWFRKDNCFSIPWEHLWVKLKVLLKIETAEFDKWITEFEIRDWKFDMANRVYLINWISPTLTTITGWKQKKIIDDNEQIRELTPIECERLQGFPDNWTLWVSNSQRYKQMWNAISINPVREIFRNLIKIF